MVIISEYARRLYLYAFGAMKNRLASSPQDISLTKRIAAGAFAGVVFWIYGLPVDTMKTLIESRPFDKTSSQLSRVVQIYKDHGIGYLYRAWPIAIARGLPSAAITLVSYDLAFEYLNGSFVS